MLGKQAFSLRDAGGGGVLQLVGAQAGKPALHVGAGWQSPKALCKGRLFSKLLAVRMRGYADA